MGEEQRQRVLPVLADGARSRRGARPRFEAGQGELGLPQRGVRARRTVEQSADADPPDRFRAQHVQCRAPSVPARQTEQADATVHLRQPVRADVPLPQPHVDPRQCAAALRAHHEERPRGR
ncbi:hypothetical protein MTP03_40960 [Tsukamurella sp. PLM1]|nr:hypothetical protein [Tsukamurella sp. PLM1]BDH59157.1 hypothetical protein MTP03_40960 [Tsukamurella sp. PLM1]